MNSKVIFGDEKVKNSLDKLKISKTEDKRLNEWLERAFQDLEKNAFCGIQIPKRLIPEDYKKRFGQLDNLWKYNLPNAWRLIYTVKKGTVLILSIVLEWMDHKAYERRFNY